MAKKNKVIAKPKEKQNVSEVECEGVVIEALPNAFFKVKLLNDSEVLCSICGKIRKQKNPIRITPGDTVKVGVSIYDFSRGRILWRMK